MTAECILLSANGGDRATAYGMSNKIARAAHGYVCTWLEGDRQNQWALVEVGTGQILSTGPVGGSLRDNHCGAAVAAAIRPATVRRRVRPSRGG